MKISKELQDYINRSEILQKYINNKIETDGGVRWTKGKDHHPKSLVLMKHICELDFAHNSDYFCFKTGGDGDSGEILMYLMDMFFELEDQEFYARMFPDQKDLDFIRKTLGHK